MLLETVNVTECMYHEQGFKFCQITKAGAIASGLSINTCCHLFCGLWWTRATVAIAAGNVGFKSNSETNGAAVLRASFSLNI